jgi:predicted DsbA family dithiol-disulfide isomerase
VKVYGEIDKHARAEGIEIDFAAISRTPNTIDAHRLIHWAGIEGKQDAVVDALFAAYFREGRDIGHAEVLCDIADSAGLDGAVTARLLQTDEDVDLIRRRDAHSREMGVNSVPTFIVANKHAVPGAQPTDLWIEVLTELQEQQTDA